MLPTYIRQGNVVIEQAKPIPIPRSTPLAAFAPYRGEEIAQLNNMVPFTKGQYVPAVVGNWSAPVVKMYKRHGNSGGEYGISETFLEQQERESEEALVQSAYEEQNPAWWQTALTEIGKTAVTTALQPTPQAEPLPAYVPSGTLPAQSGGVPSWAVPAAIVAVLGIAGILAFRAKDDDPKPKLQDEDDFYNEQMRRLR